MNHNNEVKINHFQIFLFTLLFFGLYGCNSDESFLMDSGNRSLEERNELKNIRQERSSLNQETDLVTQEARNQIQSLLKDNVTARLTAKSIDQFPLMEGPEKRVNDYLIHYGEIDEAFIDQARTYDLVVLHPTAANLTQESVSSIQKGLDPNSADDDVIVLIYVSVGEDLRTVGLSYEQMLADQRFVGNGSGPRVDPRGPLPDGSDELKGIPRKGLPSPGGTGFASYYLDDNSVINDPEHVGDGLPDRHDPLGAAFVNAGDPAWFRVVNKMTLDGKDGLVGFKEALTDNVGRGLNADGVFLDAIDTAAPNVYTDQSSPNQSEFEWTARGFSKFIKKLKAKYPSKIIMQNRGLFYFNPELAHYRFNSGKAIDFLLFENYRLNSNTFEAFNDIDFGINKHVLTPKIMAEAGREHGFTVLSLGYAEGPGIEHDTLFNDSLVGYEALIEDITEAQQQAGFRHYITNADIDLPNDFVKNHQPPKDNMPPVWSSTYNDTAWLEPPQAPTPRVGIQKVTNTRKGIKVHWDVALDENTVNYYLYIQDKPYKFTDKNPLRNARKILLKTNRGAGYGKRTPESTFAYSDIITGLDSNKQYHLLIRAADSLGNEDANEVVLEIKTKTKFKIDGSFKEWERIEVASKDGSEGVETAGPDFAEIKYHVKKNKLFLYVKTHNTYNLDGYPDYEFSRSLIFIDVDNDAGTGYPISGVIGSDLVINGSKVFSQSQDNFNDGFVGSLNVAGDVASNETEYSVPLHLIRNSYADANTLKLVFLNDEIGDYAPQWGFSISVHLNPEDNHSNSPVRIDGDFSEWEQFPVLFLDENDSPDSAGPDWLTIKAACDEDNLNLFFSSDNAFNLDGSPTYGFSRSLIFFDTDEDMNTGYVYNGVGSDFVLNGAGLFKQSSTEFNNGFVGNALVSGEVELTAIELSIPYFFLNLEPNTGWIRLQFLNDETDDMAPDINQALRLNLANCSGEVVDEYNDELIQIDGQYSDWEKVPVLISDQDDVPDSSGPDWLDIKMDHDEEYLYFYTISQNTYNLDGSPEFEFSRQLIFIDIDDDPNTGWFINGIGSDVLINGSGVFSQTATTFAQSYLGQMQTQPVINNITDLEMRFDITAFLPVGATTGKVKVLFVNDQVYDYAPELGNTVDYEF